VTDSSDPRPPKSSRRKPAREPATIDLKATVVDDRASRPDEKDQHWDGMAPEETVVAEAERAFDDAAASPEASLDSAAGTDSIGPEVSPVEPPPHESMGQEAAQEPGLKEPGSREPAFQDRPPPDEPPPSRPERRTSPAALIGSGLLGGLVGAGLIYGLQTWQQTARAPAPQNDQRLAQLEQRIGALGQQQASQAPVSLQAVEDRIRALEAARGAVDERLQAVQGAAEQASARAEEALNRQPPPAPPAPAPQNDAALAELSGRLSALEGQLQAAAQNAAHAGSTAQVLEQRIAELDQRVAERDQSAAERERRIGEQDQRLAALSRQLSDENRGAEAASQAGIRVILSDRLNEALRNGTPYGEVLEGLRKAGTDAGRLAALEPFAQGGAPTAAALAQGFKPLGAVILRDERAATGDWSERLLRMVDQVVTVRQVNEPGSTGVPSLVARIEQALARGNVAEAAAAWEALPEPARRSTEEWGRQAKAVAGALAASQAIAAGALASLNQTAQ
jgi:hypothetical protein